MGDVGGGPTVATVVAGQVSTLPLAAKPLGAERRVILDPATAELSIDGQALGKGRFQGRLTVAKHVVEARELGYFAPITDADGKPRELITNPVQFDETPAVTTRAPQFSEHTDEVLAEFGYTEDQILQLKIDGAAT